jgi:ribosome biogenesis protein Nip4
MFLGKTKNIWEPSTILLRLIAAQPYVHKVWVDDAAAWLFVCGRDVFTEHIQQNTPDLVEGVNYLIMLGDDCLGYALKNLIDIGDFLRREKWREE